MGRNRTPTAKKEAMGNPGKRALNKNEPEPRLLNELDPPEWLSAGAREVWVQEAQKFRRAQLLTEADVIAFGMLCQSVSDYRRAVRKTGEDDVKCKYAEDEEGEVRAVGEHLNPWAMVKSMAFKQTVVMLGKFGGTPQDRTRVEVNPQASLFGDDGKKPADPAASFFH